MLGETADLDGLAAHARNRACDSSAGLLSVRVSIETNIAADVAAGSGYSSPMPTKCQNLAIGCRGGPRPAPGSEAYRPSPRSVRAHRSGWAAVFAALGALVGFETGSLGAQDPPTVDLSELRHRGTRYEVGDSAAASAAADLGSSVDSAGDFDGDG